MPRIYAPNEGHTVAWGAVDFTNGVAALASGSDTTPWSDAGYAIDANKHSLTLLDVLTSEQLRTAAAYLGLTIDAGETPDSKQTLVRAIETSLSTKYLATVVVASAAGNVEAATIEVPVTSALLEGGSKAIEVAVPVTANTVALVATAIRTALAADEDIAASFTVSGADANIILTALEAAANDATLAIAISDAGESTITMGASGNTTAGVAPVAQQETVTVTTGSDGAGTLIVTVTAAVLGAGGAAVNVPVTADDDTVEEVAEKGRTALAADADIAEEFTVSGEGANIILTANTAAADDATLAIALTSADGTTCAFGASGNTTAGVAPVQQQETAAVTATAATTHAGITITGAGTYKYYLDDEAAAPLYKDDVNSWTAIVSGGQIPVAQVGKVITVARVDAAGLVTGLGNATVAVE
jgi:phosphoheptose isomerase